MTVSQGQRLRKAAAKAAKRKTIVAEKLEAQRRELAISKPRHIDLAASPIVACMMTEDFEKRGMGTLFIARKLTLGRYGACVFLLDPWCLGIKDAYFRVFDAEDYEFYRDQTDKEIAAAPMDPDVARKLVRDAAAYGASNGFTPPDDLGDLERIFGDVTPADVTFTFGVDGKPYYVVGPNDPPARVRRILETLEFNLGLNGFQYEYPVEEDEDDLIEGELGDEEPEPGKS